MEIRWLGLFPHMICVALETSLQLKKNAFKGIVRELVVLYFFVFKKLLQGKLILKSNFNLKIRIQKSVKVYFGLGKIRNN